MMMPGVLIIEALAQVGAVAILIQEENKGKLVYFAGINKATFKRKVIPGDCLRLEVEIIKRKGPFGLGKGTATVDGQIAAKAELLFAIERKTKIKKSIFTIYYQIILQYWNFNNLDTAR
jgi:3-hydroxyacyl-[acyl-carrier-protein] dehydratase